LSEGWFLSAGGYERVRGAHRRYLAASKGGKRFEAAEEVAYLQEERWTDFDSLYLALYALNLMDVPSIDLLKRASATFANEQDLKPFLSLRAWLPIEFPHVSTQTQFEDTLLDEIQVADLQSVRRRIESLVPYPIAMNSIGIGCVWLNFVVFAGRSRKSDGDRLPHFSRETVEQSPGWQNLTTRFAAHISIDAV
jgi:hypothetical protein